MFGDPDLVQSKKLELQNLVQTTSVATYTFDFNWIKGFVKWNDDALTSPYYKGLKPGVKDRMVYENPKYYSIWGILVDSSESCILISWEHAF